MTTVKITRTTMNLLVALENSRADGMEWVVFSHLNATQGSVQWAMRQGLVEVNDKSLYRITEAGQWAMVRGETPDLDAASDAAEKQLHPQVIAFLQHVADPTNTVEGWAMSKTIPLSVSAYQHRMKAQQLGLVDARGAAAQRMFHITDKGLEQLGKAPTAPKEVPAPLSEDEKRQLIDDAIQRAKDKKLSTLPTVLVPVHKEDRPAQPVQVHIEEAPVNGCQCKDCVYRDVVALLEKHVPGVSDVVSGLLPITNK